MDIFTEQLVKRPLKFLDYIIFFIIIVFIGFEVLISACVPSMLLALIDVLSIYVGIKMINLRFVEFEYIVTNGDITIDKVIAKKSRKNIVSLDLSNIYKFCRYEKDIDLSNLKKIYNVHADGDIWCAFFNDKNIGKIAVVFSPNKKTLDAIKPFLKRQVINNDFGRN